MHVRARERVNFAETQKAASAGMWARASSLYASSAEAVSAGLRSLRLSPGAGDGKGAGGEEEKARHGKGTGVAGKAGEVGVVARPVVSVQSVADGGQERSGVTRDGKPSTERGSG